VRLHGPRLTLTEHLVPADHGAFIFVLPADTAMAWRLRLEFTR
jgi:hypothetical protein